MMIRRQRRPQPAMETVQVPAPVAGLNLRAGIAALKPNEALILDNWSCKGGYNQVRGGTVSWATGLGASIGSLLEWAGPSSRKLFGATATAIYEASSAGAVGAAAVSGLNSAYWQAVNFTTAGGHFLVLANGADDVRNYDGTTWTTPSISGVTSADLIGVASFATRLWFIEKSSTKAWFLDTGSISGAATSLELGDKFAQGGKLQLIGSVSRDSSNSPLNLMCFVSSKGEVAVYQGTDPTDDTKWSLVGIYTAGPPIGNRALIPIDGDLGLLTERGVVSLRQLMATGRTAAERSAITGAIDQAIVDDFTIYGANTGWEMIVHPRSRQALVNVPRTSSTATQWALNVQTGGWSTYGRYNSPLNATCWGTFNEDLFFGTAAGTIYQAERGNQDNGGAILARLKTSYQPYAKGALQRISMVRPKFTAGGQVNAAIRIAVDYAPTRPTSSDEFPLASGSEGAIWGTSLWGIGLWGASNTPYANWVVAEGMGNVAAIDMLIRPNGIPVKLNAFDMQLEEAMGLAL